jgi:hypothetical protein
VPVRSKVSASRAPLARDGQSHACAPVACMPIALGGPTLGIRPLSASFHTRVPTALRWAEAKLAGAAPPVLLASTHVRALDYVSLAELKAHALDAEEAEAAAVAAKQQGGGTDEECGNPGSSGGTAAS